MVRRTATLVLAIAAIACGGSERPNDLADPSTTDDAGGNRALARDFRIVVSRDVGDGSALFGLDLESGAAEQLIEPMGYAGYAIWAPGGGHVVFLGEGADGVALLTLDAESGAVTELVAGMGDPVHFSPDGSSMLLAMALEDGGRGLFRQSIETDRRERIETGSAADAYARWSPAGGAIAFESGRDGNPEIYHHDLTSGIATRLTDNSMLDEWPSFSPDGTHIAWASGDEEQKHLWVMKADGTEKRQLTDSLMFGDAYPEWSPDGEQILLTARANDGSALYLVDVAMGTATAVGRGAAPTWR